MSSSPRAIDIYSHCAMSSVFEFAPTNIEHEVFPTDGVSPRGFVRRGQWEDEDDDPLNIASPEEKLEMALEMTECIAALHGFVDGPIAHVDVQLGQFFRGRDGRIKFVDYNRAEPLLYDEKEGRYCRWRAGGPGDGTLRSPEENIDAPLTEKIDVYSLGNVLYAILTGRRVWEHYDYDERVRRISEGITMRIPRPYREEAPSSPRTASGALVRVIEACWTHDARNRPSAFEVVEMLERAVADHPVAT